MAKTRTWKDYYVMAIPEQGTIEPDFVAVTADKGLRRDATVAWRIPSQPTAKHAISALLMQLGGISNAYARQVLPEAEGNDVPEIVSVKQEEAAAVEEEAMI